MTTYPDPDDSEQAFEIFCNSPQGGMDDVYDELLQGTNVDATLVGGWAAYIQSGGYLKGLNANGDDYVLLMQVGSVVGDGGFCWGDDGTLYFYIKESDLEKRDFGNVKMTMQCY